MGLSPLLVIVLGLSPQVAPFPPEWHVRERVDGVDLTLGQAPWAAYPLEGGDQAVIRAPEAALTRTVGWPELPVYHLLFAVPPGCTPMMEASVGSTREHALRAVVVGEWRITETGLTIEREDKVPSSLAGALYPSVWASIEPWGSFRGVPLWALVVRPLQQRLGTDRLVENLGMSIRITWDLPPEGGEPIEEAYLPVLRSMVINDEFAARVGREAPPRVASWDPPYPAVKVSVPPGRPTVIRRQDLATVAPALATTPVGGLTLLWKGQPVPCAWGGVGDPWEWIAFLSPPLPSEYANEGFHNVVWLGPGGGLLPMQTRDVGSVQGAEEGSHATTLTLALEREHGDYTPTGDALEWWWSHVEVRSPGQVSTTNLSVGLSILDKTKPITLTLEGGAVAWTTHRLRLALGGRTIADTTWTGKGAFAIRAPVPPEVVFVGTNVVRVDAIGQSSTVDRIWIKRVTVDFSTGTAALDSLRFRGVAAQGPHRYRVGGFRTSGIVVLDVSDPLSPIRLTGPAVEGSSGSWAVVFGDSTIGDTPPSYLAFAVERGASRPSMELRTAGVLPSLGGADYLVITHPLFASSAERLAAHRRARGLASVVVDVNEVFDRFAYGYPTSEAIDRFVAWAFGAFDPRPGFVLLVGDGSARQRHGNATSPNLIPVRLVNRVADENAYADVDDDPRRLPDLAIGRLSVQTPQQAEEFVSKIIAAETNRPPSPAHARIAFFADDASGAASQPGFAVDCEYIIGSVSPAFFPERIYLSYNGGSNDAWSDRPTMLHARAKGKAYYRPWILDTLREGTLLLTYVGHGGINTWATEWVITTDDAPEMLTAPEYPFITSFSCDTGRFDDPDYDIVMGEHFTRWREGALAFLSSSRESYPSENAILSQNLHRALLNDGIRQIGLAIQVAKYQTDLPSVCRTYSLLGDPASELPVPSSGDLLVAVSPDVVSPGTRVSGSVAWGNVSRAEAWMDLVDAFGIRLARHQGIVSLPWSAHLATPEAVPPGTGVFRVWMRSGAAEALHFASFTSPVSADTAVVTPEGGSGGPVSSRDGNILVTVPPGCVDDTTVVRITVGPVLRPSTQRHMDVCPVPGAGSGRAYLVQFDSGEPGRVPLGLRLAYDTNWVLPADVDSLMAVILDPVTNLWIGLPSTIVGGRVSAQTPRTGQFSVLVVYDRQPPFVHEVEIQEGSSWQVFHEGEYAAAGDFLRATLADEDGILASSVEASWDGEPLPIVYEASPSQQEGRVLVEVPACPEGAHRLTIHAADVYGNAATRSITVRTGAGFELQGFVAIPNPFADETALRFILSRDASCAKATIYTVSGRLIRTVELRQPSRGMNVIPWDGRDADGDRIASGVYLVRLTVEGDGGSAVAETKVVRRGS